MSARRYREVHERATSLGYDIRIVIGLPEDFERQFPDYRETPDDPADLTLAIDRLNTALDYYEAEAEYERTIDEARERVRPARDAFYEAFPYRAPARAFRRIIESLRKPEEAA